MLEKCVKVLKPLFKALLCFFIGNSSFCFAESDTEPVLSRRLLIIGCARSGTTFTTLFLRNAGLAMGHEQMGLEGCVSMWMVFEGPGLGRPPHAKFQHIFHQVRNPLDVITSCYVNYETTNRLMCITLWDYIYKHVPEIQKDDPHLVKCAKYWYYWNLKAEELSEWRFRVEELEYLIADFESRLQVQFLPEVMRGLHHQINTGLPEEYKITWYDLKGSLSDDLFLKIQNMAERYGYPLIDAE